MKKCILIFCLFLTAFTAFGKKIVVVEVTKESTAWQNFFNCYGQVVTSLDYTVGDVNYVKLHCTGAGFAWCRASREIGSVNQAENNNLLSNVQIVKAINSLLDISEIAAQSGSTRGSSSQKVAIAGGLKTQLYFVKAQWEYNPNNIAEGKVTITIETDESDMLSPRLRQ